MKNETVVHPVQPSFALGASYYFKKLMSDSPFSHFYQFQCDSDEGIISVVPDATMDIIFECGNKSSAATVYGMVLTNWRIALKRGMTYFGVRFLPGFLPEAWRRTFPQMVQGIIPMERLGLRHADFSRLTAEMDFTRKIEIFLGAFARNHVLYQGDGLFSQLVDMIFDAGGNITVERLEKETGYTRRYINKVFHKNIGIPPKMFCMVIKFQKAIQALNRGQYLSFSEVASVMGYYDQSQFTEDFKRFTSFTPKQYVGLIQRRKYNSLISQF